MNKISDDPVQQAFYEKRLAEGLSPKLAEMLALGQPPGERSDRGFLAGHCNGSQFAGQPGQGDFYRSVAEKHGQNVKGKVYLSQLAKFPGDPQAWVSGRGDVQRVCEERGYGCSGAVDVKVRPSRTEPAPDVALAPDIVDREVATVLEQSPEAGQGKHALADLREKIVKKHGQPYSKK